MFTSKFISDSKNKGLVNFVSIQCTPRYKNKGFVTLRFIWDSNSFAFLIWDAFEPVIIRVWWIAVHQTTVFIRRLNFGVRVWLIWASNYKGLVTCGDLLWGTSAVKLRSAYSWMLFASMYPARCSALQMDAMLNPNRAKSPKTAPGLPEPKNIKFE